MSQEQHRKLFLVFFFSCASSKPILFTSSETDDKRLPTQEGKQTSQESVSTSERPRSNQALQVKKTLIAMYGPRLENTAQNCAAGMRGRSTSTGYVCRLFLNNHCQCV